MPKEKETPVTPEAETKPEETPKAEDTPTPAPDTLTDPAKAFKNSLFGDLENITVEGEEPTEEPAADTDAETGGKEPTDTDAETVAPDLSELMAEHGLTGQYKSPAEVLKAVPHLRKTLNEKDEELADMRRRTEVLEGILFKKEEAARTETKKAQSISDDELAELIADGNIREALRLVAEEQGYVRKDDIEPVVKSIDSIQNEQAFAVVVSAVKSIPGLEDVADYFAQTQKQPPAGLNPRWDAMMAELKQSPWLADVPTREAFRTLHRLTEKSTPAPPNPKPPVESVSKERKERATTTGAERTSQRFVKPAGWDKMSTDEQLKHYRRQGLVVS